MESQMFEAYISSSIELEFIVVRGWGGNRSCVIV